MICVYQKNIKEKGTIWKNMGVFPDKNVGLFYLISQQCIHSEMYGNVLSQLVSLSYLIHVNTLKSELKKLV